MNHEAEPDGSDGAMVFECDLAERPEKVWRALTVPELVADWLLPSDDPSAMRPEVGRRFTLQAKPENGGAIRCEVLAAEPHRLLRYSWRGAREDATGRALDTVVTFVLHETATGGTRLRIIHDGLHAGALPLTARAGKLPPLRLRRDRHIVRRRVDLMLRRSAGPPWRLAA